MAQNAPNEVDDTIKNLKGKPGFSAYILMNNDGIVIRYENLDYTKAVMYAYHILDLYSKSKKRVAQLMEADNEVESIRLRTRFHEMIVTQHSKFTLVVLQIPESSVTERPAEENKEKESEEKAAE